MNKGLIIFIIILLAIIFGLIATKPDMDSYESWIQMQPPGEGLLGLAFSKAMQHQMISNAEYKNRLIFAIVKTRILGKDYKFLGIASLWFGIGGS